MNGKSDEKFDRSSAIACELPPIARAHFLRRFHSENHAALSMMQKQKFRYIWLKASAINGDAYQSNKVSDRFQGTPCAHRPNHVPINLINFMTTSKKH